MPGRSNDQSAADRHLQDDRTTEYKVTNGRFIIMLDEGRSILDLGNHAQKQGNVDDSLKESPYSEEPTVAHLGLLLELWP